MTNILKFISAKKLLIIFFLILSISCKKSVDTSLPSSTIFEFTGITETDHLGNLLSQIDSTDWTYDDTWPFAISELFNFADTSFLEVPHIQGCSVHPIYPNPCYTGFFVCVFEAQRGILVKTVLVDENLHVYQKNAVKMKSEKLIIDYFQDSLHLDTNRIYRLYYGFYAKDSPLFFKGHGDLKMIK